MNPPKNPMSNPCRIAGGRKILPPTSVIVNKKPAKKHPITLIMNIPQGKLELARSDINKLRRKRKVPPKALPKAMNKMTCMKVP